MHFPIARLVEHTVSNKPLDFFLFELYCSCLEEGLARVRTKEQGGGYIGRYHNFPELKRDSNGMPTFSNLFDGPVDYKNAIDRDLSGLYPHDEAQHFLQSVSVRKLLEYFRSNSRLASFYPDPPVEKFTAEALIALSVKELIDRYIHVSKTTLFDRDQFLPIYLPKETYFLQEELPIELLVPILFAKLDSERIELDNGMSIIEIPEDIQLARAPIDTFNHGHHSLVQARATHALQIVNLTIPNRDWITSLHFDVLTDTPVLKETGLFFAAFRVITGIPTGFAQVLTIPVGWAAHYKANLRPIDKVAVKQYAPSLERGAWNDPIPTVSLKLLCDISALHKNVLHMSNELQFSLALQRLNSCFLRDDSADRILDAVIGLEALLSDGNEALTYKLAMRQGALMKLSDPDRVRMTRAEISQIYKYRSAIAHGDSTRMRKNETVQRPSGPVNTVDAAVGHLRTAIFTIAQHPRFLEPLRIDEELLLGCSIAENS